MNSARYYFNVSFFHCWKLSKVGDVFLGAWPLAECVVKASTNCLKLEIKLFGHVLNHPKSTYIGLWRMLCIRLHLAPLMATWTLRKPLEAPENLLCYHRRPYELGSKIGWLRCVYDMINKWVLLFIDIHFWHLTGVEKA